MTLLTMEAITKEALDVLERGLTVEQPSEHHTLNTKDGNTYIFHKYSAGWVLYNAEHTEPLLDNMTDDQMLAHLKLLRG